MALAGVDAEHLAGIHVNMALADPQALGGLGELTRGRAGGARVVRPLRPVGRRLLHPAVHPAPDRGLRAGRLPGRAVRVDRGEVLVVDGLRRPPRERAHPRRAAGQRDALLAARRRRVLRAALLGKLPPAGLQTDRRPGGHLGVPEGDLPRLAPLGARPASATCATSANPPAAGTSRPWSSRSCSWRRCGPPSEASAEGGRLGSSPALRT